MYEFGIINNKSSRQTIIFGRNLAHAFRRAKLNAIEWTVTYVDYVD